MFTVFNQQYPYQKLAIHLLINKTVRHMVIHHTSGLHECVDDR